MSAPTERTAHMVGQYVLNEPMYMQQANIAANNVSSYPLEQQALQQLQNSIQLQLFNANRNMPQFVATQAGHPGFVQQQMPLSTPVGPPNNGFMVSSLVKNPVVTSTPSAHLDYVQMAPANKRQIEDISKSLDASAAGQYDEQQQQLHARTPRPSTPPKKQKQGTPYLENPMIHKEIPRSTNPSTMYQETKEVSVAARSFATTRYPFAPFHVIFKSNVKDRLVIDEVVKHAKEQMVELKVVSYRHKLGDNGYSLLIFVDNIESFCFLNIDTNWPNRLVNVEFSIKKPSIPPQLCLILLNVSLNIDWEEFVIDVKDRYPDVVNVIRLKNRNQRPVPTVKIELNCGNIRESILQHKQMNIGYISYKVVEYLAPVQVLLCGNCCEIGHFQKNCPLKSGTICKTCGEKCMDIKNHECSGQPNCIRCGESHKSTDAKCQIIRSYRAALTRNLLQRPVQSTYGHANYNSPGEFPLAFAQRKQPVTTVKSNLPIESVNESEMTKKLDLFLAEIKKEITKTNDNIDDLRKEMQVSLSNANKKIDDVEKQIIEIEKDVHEQVDIINETVTIILQVLNKNSDLSSEDKTSISSLIKKNRVKAGRVKNKQ